MGEVVLFGNIWHVISTPLLMILGAIFSNTLAKKLYIRKDISLLIYVWHTLLCIVYMNYTLTNPADSISYFINQTYRIKFGLGTDFVYYFTNILKNYIGLSYLGAFLVFNIFGASGLIIIYAVFVRMIEHKKSNQLKMIMYMFIFLPSISFWSSAIGKDAISFLSVSIILWVAMNTNKRKKYLIVAIFLMLLVRPHIAGFIVVAYTASVIFTSEVRQSKKFLYLLLLSPLTLYFINIGLNYAGLSDLSETTQYVEDRQNLHRKGQEATITFNSTFAVPIRLLSLLYRPTIFDVNSIFYLFAAIDNSILIYITISFMVALYKNKKSPFHENRHFLWIYVFITAISLSLVTYNMGLSLRQKWMFLPMLVYLMMSIMGKNKQIYSKKLSSSF